MIDKFDYLEPACPLSGGKEFYYPEKDAPLGRIPVERILCKVDGLFDKNDAAAAGKLLVYWRDEAVALRDLRGELSMESELVGYYRKQNDREKALASVTRALALMDMLEQGDMASGATILINCATAYKAFGMAEEALPLFARAEAVYKRILPSGDARFGGLYNNMALALADLGRYREAAQAYASALAVMEQVDRGEAECAITYINMAYLHEQLDDTEAVHRCMQTAYTLLQSDSLPRNGYYAFVLEKCAPAFRYFGDAAACEQLEKEAKAIYARS